MSYSLENSERKKADMIKQKTTDILKLLKDAYPDANDKDLIDIIDLMMPQTKDKINMLDNKTFLNLFAEFCEDPYFNIKKLQNNTAFEPFFTKLTYINTIYPSRFLQQPAIKISNFNKLKEKINKICILIVNKSEIGVGLHDPDVAAAAERAIVLSEAREDPNYISEEDNQEALKQANDDENYRNASLAYAHADEQQYNANKEAFEEGLNPDKMNTFENQFNNPNKLGGRRSSKKRRSSRRKRRSSRRKRRTSRRNRRSSRRRRR